MVVNARRRRWTQLFSEAVRRGDKEQVRALMALSGWTKMMMGGAHVDEEGREGRTPLVWAFLTGNAATVRLVLSAPGIDVNRADKNGKTPLEWASDIGHSEVMKLLLAAPGINVNRANKDSETPLYWASRWGHFEVVKLLLVAPGIDVNQADKYGRTPLEWASYNGHSEVVKLLLAAPAIDVNLADKYRRTPLCGVIYHRHWEVVKLLLAAPGIRILWECADGKTALDYARSGNLTDDRREVVSLLEEVVNVKRTYAAVLLTLVRLSESRSWSSDVAMHSLPSERAKALAAHMRDTWPAA